MHDSNRKGISSTFAWVRERRFGVAVSLFAFTVFLWVYVSDKNAHAPGADGFYTWLYARSLVFDHDLHFANDYAECGDPLEVNVDRGGGRPDNPFYMGPSVFWVPVLWFVRLFVATDTAGCEGPLTTYTLAVAPLIGAATIWLSYLCARRFAPDGSSALAAGLFGFGGSILAYATVLPSYSHVYAAFTVALVIWFSLRASERPQATSRWVLAAVAVALSVLQRIPEGIWVAVPATLAFVCFRKRPRRLAAVFACLAVAAIIGLLPQLWFFHAAYGEYLVTAHGRYFMHYAHAHPFLVLFAPDGGLFYTTPVAWLAVAGFAFGLRRSQPLRPLAIAGLSAGLVTLFLAAATIDWDGSGTYGARRLVPLTAIFIVVSAVFIERITQFLRERPRLSLSMLGILLFVSVAWTSVGTVWGLPRGLVPIEGAASQAELYGAGNKTSWSIVDDKIGDLAVLPASLVFAARYRLHPNRFRAATNAEWYVRDFKTLSFLRQDFPLHDANALRTTVGFLPGEGGASMTGARSRIVFAAQWPYATALLVHGQATPTTKIRVGRQHMFSVTWFGTAELSADMASARVPIPASEFDSGILELVFEREGEGEVVLTQIGIDDEHEYPYPFP